MRAEDLYANIKKKLSEKGIFMKDLAGMIGVCPVLLSKLDTRIPPLPRLYLIAKHADPGISDLLMYEPQNEDVVFNRKEFCYYMYNKIKDIPNIEKTLTFGKIKKLEIPKTVFVLRDLKDHLHLLPEKADFKCPKFVYEEKSIN